MELQGDEWRVVKFGVIKPRQLAHKQLQGFEDVEDVYQVAAMEISKQIPEMMGDDAPGDVLIGIERIAFMAKNLNSMVVGASIGAAVGAVIHVKTGHTVFPVVPTAWQNFLGGHKDDEGKKAAKKIATTTYGLTDVPQDAADSIGVAHYIAHTRGRLPFIDKNVLLCEHRLPMKVLMEHGRQQVDDAKKIILEAGGGHGKSERQTGYENAVDRYVGALRNLRKAIGLPPMSKVELGTEDAAKIY